MNCSKCGRALNEKIETVWNFVEGWEKPREGGGTNHLAMRTPKDVFCCNACMTLMQAGLSTGQESLL